MVYGGKPSTGCYLCRRRKIKCDEGQPGCRNCVIYGKPCPGYRQDTIFRNETHKVERLVKKTGNGSGSASQLVGADEQQQTITTAGPVVSTAVARRTPVATASTTSPSLYSPSSSSSLTKVLSPGTPSAAAAAAAATTLSLHKLSDSSWDERAICYFFDQYTTYDGSAIGVSHLGFLPSLYKQCQEQHNQGDMASIGLRRAVDATALMSLGNEAKMPSLIVRARNKYGSALRDLRSALGLRAQAVKDETLATLAVLAMFEDIAGERNGLSSSHTVGFAALMKLRGSSQLEYQRGRDLFNFAYTHTHVEILSMRDRPRFDTDWIIGQLDHTDPVHRLISSASRISHVFLEASSAQSCPETVTASKLNSWIDTGKMLDANMIEWTQNVPEDWHPIIIQSSSTDETFITYRALPLAVVWNYYRAIRIVLQKLMLELRQIRAVFFGPAPDDMEVLNIIQEMITGVCRSMAYCLGDVDMNGNRTTPSNATNRPRVRAFHGYTLLWPIWYVLSCGLATPEQEKLVRNVLVRVGSALGIRLALTLADYDYSMPGGFERFVSDMGV